MTVGQIFSRESQAIFYNWKANPVQRMLDFDFLCGAHWHSPTSRLARRAAPRQALPVRCPDAVNQSQSVCYASCQWRGLLPLQGTQHPRGPARCTRSKTRSAVDDFSAQGAPTLALACAVQPSFAKKLQKSTSLKRLHPSGLLLQAGHSTHLWHP